MFGYFLPAFLARALAADFWLAVKVFDFFLGFFFSQMGLLATLLLLRASLPHRGARPAFPARPRSSSLTLCRVRKLLTTNVWHVNS